MSIDNNSMQYRKADYCFRVVLVGDSGVGKSSIFTAYRNLHGERNSRQRDYFETKVCKRGSQVLLKVLDTQGQERYRSLTNSYFRGTHGCVLCFDVTNRASFESLERWLSDVDEYVGKEIPSVIVGTNGHISDHKREVTNEEAIAFSGKYGKHYTELISFNNENVESIFDKILDIMISNLEHSHTFHHNGSVKLDERTCDQRSKCGC